MAEGTSLIRGTTPFWEVRYNQALEYGCFLVMKRAQNREKVGYTLAKKQMTRNPTICLMEFGIRIHRGTMWDLRNLRMNG